MEGGDDHATAAPAGKAPAAEAPAAAADPTLDANGLKKHVPKEYVEKPPNACVKCFKKVFTKLFPYNSVITFTGWGKKLKQYLFAATIMHCLFIGISLALIGFEPTYYNILLALFAYSCYLTLNNCTICLYVTFLVFAITGGLTWAIAYTGEAAPSTCTTTSSNSGSSSSSSTTDAKTSSSDDKSGT